MIIKYRAEDGVTGYRAGDVLVADDGTVSVAVPDGWGVTLEPLGNHRDYCSRCGEVVTHLDAGFSPAVHGMKHDCGGTWRGQS